ncbi:MAG: glycosyltransferase [Gemmatimonadales bacterium]
MRLAVFTNMYPAQTATFFERDLLSLLAAGIEPEIFAIHPPDESLWQYSLGLLDRPGMGRERVHHLRLPGTFRRAGAVLRRRPARCLSDGVRTLAAAARYGVMPLLKTGYVLPKAWAWAAEHDGEFDHVLAYWGNYAGTCAWAFHRLLRRPVPFSIWLHAGVDLYRTPVFLRQKLLYADNIITCCEFNRGFIRDRFGDAGVAIAGKLHVSHHGLDPADFAFRPEGRPQGRLLAVGRLAAHKGYDDLLRAAAILAGRGREITVELVGDGPERQALAALAGRLGIADRVRFRGWVPFPEARLAMSEATVLVHPSDGLGDGLPNVVREAMAVGTPVVASDVAGIPDALGDGCGVLVPPRDPAALAEGLARLLDDEGERLRIAARARLRVEERYDIWRNGARLADLLRQTTRRLPAGPVPAWSPGSVSSGDGG